MGKSESLGVMVKELFIEASKVSEEEGQGGDGPNTESIIRTGSHCADSALNP
jgi:hypothetical protein